MATGTIVTEARASSRVEAALVRIRERGPPEEGQRYLGRIEVQVDPVMKPIATEAGGKFTTLDGKATIHGGSGIGTNGLLHDEVLRELAGG